MSMIATAMTPRQRTRALAVLCLSMFVAMMDATIVNGALPTLARDLQASGSQLQWIVDAYTLVFSCLLLTFGALSDRVGRRKILIVGLAWFGAASALAAFSGSASTLIGARAVMGVGSALLFPPTLATIAYIYEDPAARAKAIAIWSGVTGLAVAFGPIIGGFLLAHFWWGSIFLVNVPLCFLGVFAVRFFVPESRDPHPGRIDLPGAGLSIIGVGLLVWTVIEAPEYGWTSPQTIAGFVVSVLVLALFVLWERHTPSPMLQVSLFRNRQFSGGNGVVIIAYLCLVGTGFIAVQYFQFIRGYSPLLSGVATLPLALGVAPGAVLAPRLVARFGVRSVAAASLLLMGAALATASTWQPDSSYLFIAVVIACFGFGVGAATAAATASVMNAISSDTAGVGSAMNDTTRLFGATFGVAIAGSVMASFYMNRVLDGFKGTPAPQDAVQAASKSVGVAFVLSERAREQYGEPVAKFITDLASRAFMAGFGPSLMVLSGIAIAGGLMAVILLPKSARPDPTETTAPDIHPVDRQP